MIVLKGLFNFSMIVKMALVTIGLDLGLNYHELIKDVLNVSCHNLGASHTESTVYPIFQTISRFTHQEALLHKVQN